MAPSAQRLAEGLRATCPTLDEHTLAGVVQCFRRVTVARGESLLRRGEVWRSAIWIDAHHCVAAIALRGINAAKAKSDNLPPVAVRIAAAVRFVERTS